MVMPSENSAPAIDVFSLDHEALAGDGCQSQREDLAVLAGEVRDSFGHYLKKRPLVASSLVFLAGFYIGWKVKPW